MKATDLAGCLSLVLVINGFIQLGLTTLYGYLLLQYIKAPSNVWVVWSVGICFAMTVNLGSVLVKALVDKIKE